MFSFDARRARISAMTSRSTAESSWGPGLATDHSSKQKFNKVQWRSSAKDCRSTANHGHLCSLLFVVPRLIPGRPIDELASIDPRRIGSYFECLDAASQNLLVRKQETCSAAS